MGVDVGFGRKLSCQRWDENHLLSAENPDSELFLKKYCPRYSKVCSTKSFIVSFHFQEPLKVAFFLGMT